MQRAAGILFATPGKDVLLIKRSGTGDHGGQWAFPGGGIEEGEGAEEAARRECREEIDITHNGPVMYWTRRVRDDVDFVTFLARVPECFGEIKLNDEHTDYRWVNYQAALYGDDFNLHPGARIALLRFDMDELDIAEAIRDDELSSPQPYENMWLYDMRITGTGLAYRKGRKEYVWRDESLYLTERFLRRCNGLNVILEHPKGKNTVDTEEFRNRIIGNILLPYIKHDIEEVWGIAKIYDATAADMMLDGDISTSPAVVFRDQTVNETVEDDGGNKLLIEGNPSLLDHLAVCVQGVWDKGGAPTGVEVSHLLRSSEMAKEETDGRADANSVPVDSKQGQQLDKILAHLDSLHTKIADTCSRMDSFEANFKKGDDAKKDAAEDGKEEGEARDLMADKARKDEAEEPKKEPEEAAKDAAEEPEAEEEEEGKEPEAAADADKLARADAATNARIDRIERLMKPRSNADRAMFADFQAQADKIFQAYDVSDSAPRALDGEGFPDYQQRILSKLKTHSSGWKDVNLYDIRDKSILGLAAKQIFHDAYENALRPATPQPGVLRPVVDTDITGRKITRFYGDPEATWGMFKSQSRRLTGINLKPNG